MRNSRVAIGAAMFLSSLGAGAALARPLVVDRAISQASEILQIQLRCDQGGCRDLRTGAYTASHCDRRGCRPGSAIIGYGDPRVTPQHQPGYGRDRGAYYGRHGNDRVYEPRVRGNEAGPLSEN